MNQALPTEVLAEPSSVRLVCGRCETKIACAIAVRVVLEPADDGQRKVYALARVDSSPLWNHYLVHHGPPDEGWDL